MDFYGESVVETLAGPNVRWTKRVRRWRWVPFVYKEIEVVSAWGELFKIPYSSAETMSVTGVSANGLTVNRGGA